ncbi:hypothetical protein O6H91_08G092700 [Diphasiastrum complanatum]|uniref:Uncharacterized protein n=1 Tax=Diphasiastrum complanatum TaxID=34168 RepID=A0ACC2CZY3_DIPCM|nr:hypothetical protein O6H91_08G092700 [Diphasiastrum complanatum]
MNSIGSSVALSLLSSSLSSSSSSSFSSSFLALLPPLSSTTLRSGCANHSPSRRTTIISSSVAADGQSLVLKSEAWREKARSLFQTDSRPILLFDAGICNFCNAGVNFVLENDPEGRLRFAALQSDAGKALLKRSGRAIDDISSVVFVDRDGAYTKSEAVLRTAQCLQSPYPSLASLALLAPLFFRDIVYDNVANNRYTMFGQSPTCRTSDSRFYERFIE